MSARLGPYDPNTIVAGNCLEVMGQMPDGCCDLIFADPPYNKGKADWDRGHDWHGWVAEAIRILKLNGALWVIHDDPEVLIDISRFIVGIGGPPRINWITWDKYNGATAGIRWRMNRTKLHPQGKRSFDQDAEFLIYHTDDGQWRAQCDGQRKFIFEPLRAYLDGELKRSPCTKRWLKEQWMRETGTKSEMPRHWFEMCQWELPTPENYEWLREHLNSNGGNYLCREREDLHREYEELRPTFNNPGKVSSVWQGPPAAKKGHETPKPEWLLERIVSTASNEGDLVADFFIGSGTTAVVADRLGRKFFGCDINPEYVQMSLDRITQDRLKRSQLSLEGI